MSRSTSAGRPEEHCSSADEPAETPAVRGHSPGSTADSAGQRMRRLGRYAWAVLGIAGVIVVGWALARLLAVVVIPLLLALFPAALLAPAVGWLDRHGLPRWMATLIAVVVALGVVGGVFALIVPRFLAQLPELVQSLTEGGSRLDELIHRLPSVDQDATAVAVIRNGVLALVGGVNAALLAALDLLVGLLLVFVLLVCYLCGGSRIAATGTALLPARWQPDARELIERMWSTLGSYTRALFLVALFDATAIGVGLWLLGVPLVLPLAVLVFFGAFIPYIGAFLSGLLAVLVALADAGLGTALAVLALIVVVQQIDGNVVQPKVVGSAVRLSIFTVIVAIGIGAALLGVLGAFLAVPFAACGARVITFLREPDRRGTGNTEGAEPAARNSSGG